MDPESFSDANVWEHRAHVDVPYIPTARGEHYYTNAGWMRTTRHVLLLLFSGPFDPLQLSQFPRLILLLVVLVVCVHHLVHRGGSLLLLQLRSNGRRHQLPGEKTRE